MRSRESSTHESCLSSRLTLTIGIQWKCPQAIIGLRPLHLTTRVFPWFPRHHVVILDLLLDGEDSTLCYPGVRSLSRRGGAIRGRV